MENIRLSVEQGIYYPRESDKLNKLIESSMLQYAKEEKIENCFALITPSGNYQTALRTYSIAYSQLIGKEYDTIIILGYIYKLAFPSIALTKYDKFSCPLGELQVDHDSNKIIEEFNKELIIYNDNYFKNEHTFEVQLPFINNIFKDKAKILPIIIGESNTKLTVSLSLALKNLIEKSNKRYLIIVTTNLSENLSYLNANNYDKRFIDYLLRNNPDYFSEQLAIGEIKAKGGAGVVTIMRLAKLMNKKNIRILDQINSGDIDGEKIKVEGYVGAIIF